MSSHDAISPGEAADRLAIRELIDAYAHCADRRLPEQQADLYAENAKTLVYTADPATSEPTQVLTTRAEHIEGFRTLSQYVATTHFNGQSTIVLDGATTATGESYCLAHHLSENGQERSLLILSIRYEDTFTKHDGAWLFAERKLIIDWSDIHRGQP